MSIDSRTYFNHITEKEKKNRRQLTAILVVCFANFIVMMSFAFNRQWWIQHPWIMGTLSFVYIFYLTFICINNKGTLFSDKLERLKHWANYTESSKSTAFSYAEHIQDNDLLEIATVNETVSPPKDRDLWFVRVGVSSSGVSLKRLRDSSIIHEEKFGNNTSWDIGLERIEKHLKSKGLSIIAIYNKFGDIKWLLLGQDKEPSKWRKAIYRITVFLWLLMSAVVTLAPLAVMFISYANAV